MKRLALLALAAAFFAAPAAQAQTAFMPYLGYNLEAEDLVVGVGARVGLPVAPSLNLALQPAIETTLGGDGTFLQGDVNVVAQFGAGAIAPYAGAGLAIAYSSIEIGNEDFSDTSVGFNLLGGAAFQGLGAITPFAQVRYSNINEGDALTIHGGAMFYF